MTGPGLSVLSGWAARSAMAYHVAGVLSHRGGTLSAGEKAWAEVLLSDVPDDVSRDVIALIDVPEPPPLPGSGRRLTGLSFGLST